MRCGVSRLTAVSGRFTSVASPQRSCAGDTSCMAWPPHNVIICCSNCLARMFYDVPRDQLRCGSCGNFMSRQYYEAHLAPKTKCSQCGAPSPDVVCPACVAQFKQMFAAGSQTWQQTTHDCPYCSSKTIGVAMRAMPVGHECTTCGHIEHKTLGFAACPCRNCYNKRRGTQTAAGVAAQYAQWSNANPFARSQMPKPDVRIFWDTSVSAYRVTLPYNTDIVDFLGKQIPVSDRSFDKSTKIWTIVERQLAPFQQFLKLMGIVPTVITRAQAEAAHSSGSAMSAKRTAPVADVALEFIRLAGADAMNKAYLAACMTLHPDRGGSMAKMAALNVAWERLQKEVYNSAS